MSVLHRNRHAQAAPDTVLPPRAGAEDVASSPARPAARSRTRTSAAWVGICLAAALLVVLIVFLLQNTGNVEVSFLWMAGSVPLAIALLMAAVGAALFTMSIAVARITQLRRRYRRDH